MSDFDRALPPSDRQETPDAQPDEKPSDKIKRICRERGWTIAEPVTRKEYNPLRRPLTQRLNMILEGKDPDEPDEPGSEG